MDLDYYYYGWICIDYALVAGGHHLVIDQISPIVRSHYIPTVALLLLSNYTAKMNHYTFCMFS